MTGQRPGVANCHECGRRVLFAVTPERTIVALDPDETGRIVGWQDEKRIARCRLDDHGQLALGEHLFRLHDPGCPARGEVIDFQAERLRRRPNGEQARASEAR
jgi:hypothetical protein